MEKSRSLKNIIKIDRLLKGNVKIIDVAEIADINNKELKPTS